MKFGGWQRLNAEYAKQFGVETPVGRPTPRSVEGGPWNRPAEPAVAANKPTIVYWIVTALFCLQMSFTAYAQLRRRWRGVHHLGFPAYFRVELSWANSSAWCCCLRRCRRGSRSGPTPASPSTRSALIATLGGRWPGGVGLRGTRALGLSYLLAPLSTPVRSSWS